MAFIKFTERGKSYAAKATISKAGMLSFSDGAKRRYRMGDYQYCVLYYDPDTKRIGIELTNNTEAEGARKIRHRDTGCDVSAKAFLEYFNIGYRKTTRFELERDEDSGMLVINLTNGAVRAICE